jgi:glycosyltransferase involved in cell wall biosynthesis
MRVAIDVSSLLKPPTGVGIYTGNLVEGLLELSGGPEYLLWANALRGGLHREGWPPGGARYVRTRIPGKVLLRWWARCSWPPLELLAGSFDLFHSPNFFFHRVRRGRRIATIHDLFFLREPSLTERYGGQYWRRVLPARAGELDAVIAVSRSTAADVEELLGIPSSRIVVIGEGVDRAFRESLSAGEVEGTLSALGIDRPYLLAVGTLEPRKNFPFLIRTFARWSARRSEDLLLVIAGQRGWGAAEVEEAIRETGLGERVRLVSYLSGRRLLALYRGCVAFLFPSRYEGFGLPLLEAMAAGAPVIAARNSAIPEVVGDAALLHGTEDGEELEGALDRLVDDGALREELIARGRRRVERFTWRAAAEATCRLYRSVAGR